MARNWYTQREWDRIVGWGEVPEEYKYKDEDDEQEDRSIDEDTDD